MASSIGSLSSNYTLGPVIRPLITQPKNILADSLSASAALVSEKLADTGAQTAATVSQTAIKRSVFSRIMRFLSGNFADDITTAFEHRKEIPFKEGFKKSFNFTTTCETTTEGVKNSGKITNAIAKVFPFVKNPKISKLGRIFNTNTISMLIIYGMQLIPIYKAFKKYGSSEGLKELLKFGITIACMAGAEALIAVLSVYTGGLTGFLKLFAPVIGSQIGIWLGKKILGKSAEEKEKETKLAKHNQQLQELIQNPKIIQKIQQDPAFLQQIQQDPDLTDRLYQEMKAEQNQQNQQNPQSMQSMQNMQNQIGQNFAISPEEQQRRYAYASQFGNPNLSTSLGSFGNLVHNVDPNFAQMVARHESLYNPFQSFMLCQKMNEDLAAHGYIF